LFGKNFLLLYDFYHPAPVYTGSGCFSGWPQYQAAVFSGCLLAVAVAYCFL
jgi:hypothetical protein